MPDLANVIIAEVKTGPCALNGPWTHPSANNMGRVLKAIGCVPESAIDQACDNLQECGCRADDATTVRLVAVGESRSDSLPLPLDQQITWDDIIGFCIGRFKAYEREKSSVGQWDPDGRQLRLAALRSDPKSTIRSLFGLHVERT